MALHPVEVSFSLERLRLQLSDQSKNRPGEDSDGEDDEEQLGLMMVRMMIEKRRKSKEMKR